MPVKLVGHPQSSKAPTKAIRNADHSSFLMVTSVVVLILATLVGVRALSPSHPKARSRHAAIPVDQSSPYGRNSSATPALVPHTQAPPGEYANPVSTLDFPDPDIVDADGTYVAFATGNTDNNVSEMSTTDLGSWPDSYDDLSDALPEVGSWATVTPFERVWAPSVIEDNGTWLLFYAAVDPALGVRCVGVATSDTVTGPYDDDNPQPLVCQPQLGGSIDPDAYVGANGQLYLAWKSNDGSSVLPAALWSVALTPSPSGATLDGSPVTLVNQDQNWESTMENPDMVIEDGQYLLLFSGGLWETAGYGTGYAICQGPLGPCQEPFDHPILASDASVAGPGGASVFADDTGQLWVAYAAWSPPDVGYGDNGSRSLRLDPLCPEAGTPVIPGPSTGLQSLTQVCPSTSNEGYLVTGSDGSTTAYGMTNPASGTTALTLNAPIVATAVDEANGGYWDVASDGGVFAFGGAPFYGSMGGQPLNEPIVGMAATADGGGYWLVASDGGIFAFGDAGFLGSMGGHHLNEPIVGMALDRWSGGYWLVASDGGIFAFDAPFYGSMGGHRLVEPMVGMFPAGGGAGYWLVARDGGIFSFGQAPFLGSTGGMLLDAPIVGGASDGFGSGYWLVASDGGIFAFGNAAFSGSTPLLALGDPIVAMVAP